MQCRRPSSAIVAIGRLCTVARLNFKDKERSRKCIIFYRTKNEFIGVWTRRYSHVNRSEKKNKMNRNKWPSEREENEFHFGSICGWKIKERIVQAMRRPQTCWRIPFDFLSRFVSIAINAGRTTRNWFLSLFELHDLSVCLTCALDCTQQKLIKRQSECISRLSHSGLKFTKKKTRDKSWTIVATFVFVHIFIAWPALQSTEWKRILIHCVCPLICWCKQFY